MPFKLLLSFQRAALKAEKNAGRAFFLNAHKNRQARSKKNNDTPKNAKSLPLVAF